jgi:hypothetical protein
MLSMTSHFWHLCRWSVFIHALFEHTLELSVDSFPQYWPIHTSLCFSVALNIVKCCWNCRHGYKVGSSAMWHPIACISMDY